MRALPILALAATTGLILAVTVRPDPSATGYLSLLCVFCGDRATADVLANVILFVPFGAALAAVAPARPALWRYGLLLSLAIEGAQRFLAGRDASIGDVLTNTLGTAVGVALWGYAAGGARYPGRWGGPVSALACVGILALTTSLLRPAVTAETYFAMWTPLLGHLEWYRGRVLDARLNGVPLRPRPVSDRAPVRALVQGEGTLDVRFIAADATSRVSALVAVYDAARRELLLLGPDRDAVVWRHRRRAAAWGLDEPDVRFEGLARTWQPGDTLALRLERAARTVCLSVDEGAPVCQPATTPGRAWSLVLYPETFAPWMRRVLDAAWLGGLALLVGWCAGSAASAALSGGLLLLAVLAAPLLGSAGATPAELLGVVAGLPLGVWARRAAA